MYYLIPYCAMSLGAFAVSPRASASSGAPVTLDNLAGFGWERPFFGVSMWVFMLGFLGFPLTGGFWGKIYVFARDLRARLVVADRDRRRLRRSSRPPTTWPSSGRCSCATAPSCTSPRPAARRRASSCSGSASRVALVVTVGSFFAVAAADRRRPGRGERAAALSELRLRGREAAEAAPVRRQPRATPFSANSATTRDERRDRRAAARRGAALVAHRAREHEQDDDQRRSRAPGAPSSRSRESM